MSVSHEIERGRFDLKENIPAVFHTLNLSASDRLLLVVLTGFCWSGLNSPDSEVEL